MTFFGTDPVASTVGAYDVAAEQYAENSKDRAPLAHLHAKFTVLTGANALVLELGCGPSHDAAELARYGPTVIGIDPSRGLLRQGRSQQVIASSLLQGEARSLPFAAASFDGIWACASLLHVPHAELPKALAEVRRVLKARGVLFTSMSEGDSTRAIAIRADALPERLYFYHQEEDWATLVRGAGLEILDQSVTHNHVNPGATGWIETFARKP